MSSDLDFTRAVSELKLRLAVEDVVREWVPALKKAGRLWEACCPFHDENTPSFKVDPAKQTWRCYGACQEGGDVISFVMKSQNLSFSDATEMLGSQVGVVVPRGKRSQVRADDDPGLAALSALDGFFQSQLMTPAGRAAREYLHKRGMGENAIKAFGLGWSPSNGQDVVRLAHDWARESAGQGNRGADPIDLWVRAGILRRGEDGGAYSFFRGRLMVPIHDFHGRTIGFGARRIQDGEDKGPKYINSSENEYFHKGKVIYALDRAKDAVRRSKHLILVEGYTDVIAAHGVGLGTVCAVLGTATTETHAALVRRSGARQVTLVFDGDNAGRQAAWRALDGLLALDVDLRVAALPEGSDPADLCAQGAGRFSAHLENADDWFDFLLEGLRGLSGKEQAKEVDRVLRLLGKLKSPVYRSSLHGQLAQHLGMQLSTIEEAWKALSGHQGGDRSRSRPGYSAGHTGGHSGGQERAYTLPRPDSEERGESQSESGPALGHNRPKKPVDKRVMAAYKASVGAVLLDSALVPRIRPLHTTCPNASLVTVIGAILALYEDDEAVIDESSVMTQLGDDPLRNHISGLVAYASDSNFPPHELLEASLNTLSAMARRDEIAELRLRIQAPDLQAEDRQDLIRQLTEQTRELQGLSHTSPYA